MSKYLRRLLACLLLIALTLCGCANDTPTLGKANGQAENSDSTEFEAFTRQLFVDYASSDAMTLHYTLTDPSAYNIDLDEINLGRISLDEETISSANNETEDALKQLHSMDYNKLTKDQQLTYDILDKYFQTDLSIDGSELYFYSEALSSTSGIHSTLPILMSEYTFYDQEDIDIYLTLLEDFPGYFDNILAFEQAKSDEGLFMSDESVEEVVTACEDFIANPEENLLIEIFPEKLESVEGLTDTEIDAYTEKNRETVLESVIPAYETLIEGMNALKGSGVNENGLYYYEHGQEYYEYLVKTQTGSEKTPDELIQWVEDTLYNDMIKMAFILSADESLYERLYEDYDIDENDPEKMLSTLQTAIKDNFPEPITEQYTLKYVHQSLEDSMNPAFYMIPPVDAPYSNVIYLNESMLYDNLSTFTTLAHEGYPGHLYQHAAFAATDPDPIREALSFLGYVEGWATYVENMAYQWSGLDNGLANLLSLNYAMTLCLYARADLGIHYEGWTESDLQVFLTEYGFGDEEIVHDVFRAIVTDPVSYLPYCIGSMEFQELCEETKDAMEDDFDLKAFHAFLLNLGPCQFDIIEKYIQQDFIGIQPEETEE